MNINIYINYYYNNCINMCIFPLLGLFVAKQIRRFRITVRLYKSELSAGSRSYGAIKKGATSV